MQSNQETSYWVTLRKSALTIWLSPSSLHGASLSMYYRHHHGSFSRTSAKNIVWIGLCAFLQTHVCIGLGPFEYFNRYYNALQHCNRQLCAYIPYVNISLNVKNCGWVFRLTCMFVCSKDRPFGNCLRKVGSTRFCLDSDWDISQNISTTLTGPQNTNSFSPTLTWF